MEFAWDEEKARSNLEKHEVSFDEAALVFDDPNRLIDLDDRFDYGEERLRVIGMSPDRLLTVICVEIDDALTRIISARQASVREEILYFSSWTGR